MNDIIYSSDNVILTHVIKCRIGVGELQDALNSFICSICQSEAQYYCENCRQYFC